MRVGDKGVGANAYERKFLQLIAYSPSLEHPRPRVGSLGFQADITLLLAVEHVSSCHHWCGMRELL